MLGTPFSLSLVKSISYHPWWIDSHLVSLIGEGNFSSNTYVYIYIHIYHVLKLFRGWPMVIPHSPTWKSNPPRLINCHQSKGQSHIWLVVSTLWKNMKVSWDCYSQYIWEQNVPNHQPDIVLYHYHLLSFVLASLTSNFKVHHTCDLCKQQKHTKTIYALEHAGDWILLLMKHENINASQRKTSFDGLTPAARCAAHMQSRSCPSPAEPARARSKAMSWHASSMRHFFPTRTNRWH